MTKRKYKVWCNCEVEWLKLVYPHIPNYILTERFGVSEGSIETKAYKLGIKKTEEAKYEALSRGVRRYYEKQELNGKRYRKKLYVPGHPRAVENKVFEHVIIMEKKLGRYLESWEYVYHIDGDSKNNDPDNLYVKSKVFESHIDEEEIISKKKHGVQVKQLMEMYGLTTRTIYKILHRNGLVDEKLSEKSKKARRIGMERQREKKDNKE